MKLWQMVYNIERCIWLVLLVELQALETVSWSMNSICLDKEVFAWIKGHLLITFKSPLDVLCMSMSFVFVLHYFKVFVLYFSPCLVLCRSGLLSLILSNTF